jgi:hypothetical protein
MCVVMLAFVSEWGWKVAYRFIRCFDFDFSMASSFELKYVFIVSMVSIVLSLQKIGVVVFLRLYVCRAFVTFHTLNPSLFSSSFM